MDYQEKYDELTSIIDGIDSIIDDITKINSEYYIDLLNELKYEAENEQEEVEEILRKQEEEEEREMNRMFENSRL